VACDLHRRGREHDSSKLEPPEKAIFDVYGPKLRGLTYSADPDSEYQQCLRQMDEALEHHYKHNDHHPEHFENGIRDMNLIQLVEMFCDWVAATKRHDDGDIRRSIYENADRFGYGDELRQILLNTVKVIP
jgi:hypothetical protein